MESQRRDSKHRVLRRGESIRANGKYQFKYHIGGKAHFLYSWRLEPTDPQPKGKKPDLSLREKEKQLGYDLDACYDKSLNGIQKVSPPVKDLAEEYLKKYKDPKKACKEMIKNQVAKCTTSGFITGFGGFIVMPVTIPANIGSVLYVQMRMVACTAYMAGLELNSDQVQTFVYACLAGVSVNEVIKQAGIKVGVKMAQKGIEKIPGKALVKINQKIGFRFITKFGEKGIVNLGKMLPGVGAVINDGLDYAETKVIAGRAYKMFFEGDYTAGEKEADDAADADIIDVDVVVTQADDAPAGTEE